MNNQKGHDLVENAMITDNLREITGIVSKLPKQSSLYFAGIAVGYAAALGIEIDQPIPTAEPAETLTQKEVK